MPSCWPIPPGGASRKPMEILVRRRNNVAAGVLFTGPGEPEIIRLR
jgi:hypothetical protein